MSTEENIPVKYDSPTASRRIDAKNINSVVPNIPVMGADFVQCMLDFDCQMCTFQFSRNHPLPKNVDGSLQIEGVNTEAFLEVKIPLVKAFQAAAYLHRVMMQTKDDLDNTDTFFGPVFVQHRLPRDKDEK
jgi:hypothetical protein